ncbi:hypothetical protein [Mameliella alba]|uniref:Uncharacterized protein n=1 Tax=Mameliella alba TaxID=561184 RepID=A0A0B3SKY9_9RHOB|nr:hypothetical protein [Mameliella alba]KHQ51229.1 hypothetical protein OA50_04262 [Mameliella alba]
MTTTHGPTPGLPPAPAIDHNRIAAAIELLAQVSPEARLLQLRNLCVNNGLWCVPEDARDYAPVLFEVQLFGVPAVAETPGELPTNWLRAARRILEGAPAVPSTAHPFQSENFS